MYLGKGAFFGQALGNTRDTYYALRRWLFAGQLQFALTPNDLLRGKWFAPFVCGIYAGKNFQAPYVGDMVGTLPVPAGVDYASLWFEFCGDVQHFEGVPPAGQAMLEDAPRGTRLDLGWQTAYDAVLDAAGYELTTVTGDDQLASIVVKGAKRGGNVGTVVDLPTRGRLYYDIKQVVYDGGVSATPNHFFLFPTADVAFLVTGSQVDYVAGQRVRVELDGDPDTYMAGTVVAYDAGGLLHLLIDDLAYTGDPLTDHSPWILTVTARKVTWFDDHDAVAQGVRYDTADGAVTCEPMNDSGLTIEQDLTYAADVAGGAGQGPFLDIRWPAEFQIHYLLLTPLAIQSAGVDSGVLQVYFDPDTLPDNTHGYQMGDSVALVFDAPLDDLNGTYVITDAAPGGNTAAFNAAVVHADVGIDVYTGTSTRVLAFPREPEDTVLDNGADVFGWTSKPLPKGDYAWQILPVDDDGEVQSAGIVERDPITLNGAPLAPVITSITGTAAALTVHWTLGENGCTFTVYVSPVNQPVNFGQVALPAPITTAEDATSQLLAAVTVPTPLDREPLYDTLAAAIDAAVEALKAEFADPGADSGYALPWYTPAFQLDNPGGSTIGEDTFTLIPLAGSEPILAGDVINFTGPMDNHVAVSYDPSTNELVITPALINDRDESADVFVVRQAAWSNDFVAELATQTAAIDAAIVAFAEAIGVNLSDFVDESDAAAIVLTAKAEQLANVTGWMIDHGGGYVAGDSTLVITGGSAAPELESTFYFTFGGGRYQVASYDPDTNEIEIIPPLSETVADASLLNFDGVATADEWRAAAGPAYYQYLAFLGGLLNGDVNRYVDAALVSIPPAAPNMSLLDVVTPFIQPSLLYVIVRSTKDGVQEHGDDVWVQELDADGTQRATRPNPARIESWRPIGTGLSVVASVIEDNANVPAKYVDFFIVPDGDTIDFDDPDDTEELPAAIGNEHYVTLSVADGDRDPGWYIVAVRSRAASGAQSLGWIERKIYLDDTAPAGVLNAVGRAVR